MRHVVDASALIDVLCGVRGATMAVLTARSLGSLHGSEITRAQVLSRMREPEADATLGLFAAVEWHPVDSGIAQHAGALGRQLLSQTAPRLSQDTAQPATAAETAKAPDAAEVADATDIADVMEVDATALIVAATADILRAEILTGDIGPYPMVDGLVVAY